MIALLAAAAALAGPVSVTYDWPVGWTRSVSLRTETQTTWGTTSAPVPPDTFGQGYGGVLVDVALRDPDGDGFFPFASAGARTWSASWDVAPSFSTSVTELFVDGAVRQELGDEGIVPFGAMGGGVQVTTAKIERFPTHVNPMLHGFGAFGARTSGRVRLVAQARVSVGLRLDHYVGRIEAPTSPLVWQYFPGSASFSFVAGLEFG